MSKRKTKPQLVEKVSVETGVDRADLDRLPEDALEKLDAVVPDQEELPNDVQGDEGENTESEALPDVQPTESSDRQKVFVGFHPITGEKVYL